MDTNSSQLDSKSSYQDWGEGLMDNLGENELMNFVTRLVQPELFDFYFDLTRLIYYYVKAN